MLQRLSRQMVELVGGVWRTAGALWRVKEIEDTVAAVRVVRMTLRRRRRAKTRKRWEALIKENRRNVLYVKKAREAMREARREQERIGGMMVGLRSRRERRFYDDWQEWPLHRLVVWWEGRLRAAQSARRRKAQSRKRARNDGGCFGGDIRLLLGGGGGPGSRKRAKGVEGSSLPRGRMGGGRDGEGRRKNGDCGD